MAYWSITLVRFGDARSVEELIFLTQILLVGILSYFLFHSYFSNRLLLATLISLWVIACGVLLGIHGEGGQLLFYSNDQKTHELMVLKFESVFLPLGEKAFLSDRLPLIVPAYVLTLAGLTPTVALKAISLISYLGTAIQIERFFTQNQYRLTLFRGFIMLGPAVFFFSTLALRETMMAFFVTQLFLGRNLGLRAGSLLALTMLRPHLAFAVVVGLVLGSLIGFVRGRLYFTALVAGGGLATSLGLIAYHFEYQRRAGLPFDLSSVQISISQILLLMGGFIGVQFFWADFDAINKTFLEVLIPRLLVLDTFLVPALFTMTLLFPIKTYRNLRVIAFLAITAYTGITTSSEFIAFRQNIPFIPVMGVAIVQMFELFHTRERNPQEVKSA